MVEAKQADSSMIYQAMMSYAYVVLWITLSATVIMYNKYVLAYSGFGLPVTLTLWHMLFCSVVSAALVKGGLVAPVQGMTFEIYKNAIVPIAAAFAIVLWLGNAAYLYLTVAFIQMLKALMPMAVFTVGNLFGTETFSQGRAINMVVITVGVMIAAYGELNFVLIGFVLQLISIAVEATRLTMVQILLQKGGGPKLNSLTTMYYVSPCCFAFLLVPWVFLEYPKLTSGEHEINIDPLILVSNAVAAFALNLAVYLLIGKTSALTMNIAGVVKDWILIGLSVWLYKAPVSALNIGGYLIAFAAVLWYNYSKIQAALADKAAQELAASKALNKDPETQPLTAPAMKETALPTRNGVARD
mmetsp:Transcript_4266/g.12303  ORF Transcript_4266/g.12303 Transcript_4266/m.12303 type:complete len:357 (-) Transcript_4266:454-1524(-)